MAREETFSVQCSKVGSFIAYKNFTLYVVLKDRDGNPATNKSYVDYNVYCSSNGDGSLNAKHTIYFEIDGQVKRNETVQWYQNGPYIRMDIASGTIEVDHNNKTQISFGASIRANSFGVAASLSGNFELENIPRNVNIISFSVSNIPGEDGLTKVKYSWKADAECDWAWFSKDNGTNWENLDNSGVITGLEPGKTYNFKVRARRKDSQVITESWTIPYSTYSQATITEPLVNFSLNSNKSLTVKCINPSGASFKYFLDLPSGIRRYTYGPTNELSHTWSTEEIFSLLQYVPNSNNISIKIGIATLIGGNETYYSESVGTYNVVDSNPIFSNFTYKDIDENIVNNLTGDNQIIIKGYSDVQAIVTVANKASPQNYATMSKYGLSIGEKTQDVNYSETNDVSATIPNVTSNKFTMYAFDSRGNSTPKEIIAKTYIEYQNIVIKGITAVRKGNVQAETTLKFVGNIWNGNFGKKENSITRCYYKYKKVTSNDWSDEIKILPIKNGNMFSFDTVISGDLGAEGFDIENTFEIKVYIYDELSNNEANPASFILGPGTPAMAIYKNNVAIGGKYDVENSDIRLQIYGNARANNLPETGALEIGTYDDVKEGQKLQRTGLFSVERNETKVWYHLINLRHRNGYGDGIDYGLQIRVPMFDTKAKLNVRQQYLNDWGEWRTIQEEPILLYENLSGTIGSVPLSEACENFKWLEIHFKDYDNNYGVAKAFPNVYSGLESYFYLSDSSTSFSKGNTIFPTGNNINRIIAWEVSFKETGGVLGIDTINSIYTLFNIIRVLGYR